MEILSSSIAALTALGPTERIVAACALVLDVAALSAIRHLLAIRRPAEPRCEEPRLREAA